MHSRLSLNSSVINITDLLTYIVRLLLLSPFEIEIVSSIQINQSILLFNVLCASNSYFKDHRWEEQSKAKTGLGARNNRIFLFLIIA